MIETSSLGPRAASKEVGFEFRVLDGRQTPWHVVGMDCDEGLSRLYECRLELETGADVDLHGVLGARAVLVLRRTMPGGGQLRCRRIAGVVWALEDRGWDGDAAGGQRRVRVWLAPMLRVLAEGSRRRVFEDVSVPEVIAAVVGEGACYRLGAGLRMDLARPHRRRERVVQYDESDLDFLQRLLAAEAMTFYFEHTVAWETLVLVDDLRGAPSVETARGMVSLLAPRTEAARYETLGEALPVYEQRAAGEAPGAHRLARPFALRDAVAVGFRREMFTWSPRAGRRGGDDELRVAAWRGFGSGNVPEFMPGRRFALAAGGEGDYLLTAVRHAGRAPAYPGDAGVYGNDFTCVPARTDGTVGLPPPPARPVVRGPQTATVLGGAGARTEPDARGRIAVRFHWESSADGAASTCWVPVADAVQAGVGVELPRGGTEVVVEFLDGDPDRAIVVGCVRSGSAPWYERA